MSQNVTEVAQRVYATFSQNERHGAKFGMVPHAKMPTPDETGIPHHDLVVEIFNLTRKPAAQVATA